MLIFVFIFIFHRGYILPFFRKVLVRMNTEISRDVIQAICACKPNVIESVLCILRDKIDIYLAKQKHRSTGRRDFGQDVRPEADQDRGNGLFSQ